MNASAWKQLALLLAATLALRLIAGLFGAGEVAALATLVRPSWLLFTPFALAAGLVLNGLPARRRYCAWIAVGMMVGLVAAMMPWWLRNVGLTGRFVPTTLQVGASLYDGWNPQATGASNMEFVPKFIEDQRRQEPAGEQREPGFEYRLDRRLRSEALVWARAHPGRAVQLAFIKLGRTWNVWPNERAFSGWPLRLTVLCTYVPLVLLGIAGAARTIRCGWPYILCWLPAVYFSVLHMVLVGSIRYRQPAMLGLIVLAAGAIGSWKPGRGPAARQIAMEGRLPSSDE